MRTKLTLLMLMMAATAAFAQPAHYITFNGTDQYMRIPHHEDFLIGAGNNGGAPTYYCNGSFGNVRFYSMALSAEEMAVDLRVDAVHYGVTKIRQMVGGAFGHLNPKLYTDFNYHRKQDILLCSNMRFKLTWFNVDFENELRICNVKHSDRKMQLHYESVINIPGVKEVCLLQPNVVSAPMFLTVWKELKQHCFFYDLNEDANVVCWMYSFDTSKR